MIRITALLSLVTLTACASASPHGGVGVGYAGGAVRVAPSVGASGDAGTFTYRP